MCFVPYIAFVGVGASVSNLQMGHISILLDADERTEPPLRWVRLDIVPQARAMRTVNVELKETRKCDGVGNTGP